LRNSTDPLNSDELVPPSVNTPPGTSCVCALDDRVSQNAISGLASWPFVAKVSQNGVAPVLAMVLNARPMIPETAPSRRPEVNWFTLTTLG
jgi:hypothetical protein